MKNKIFLTFFAVLLMVPAVCYPLRIDNPKMRIPLAEGQSYAGVVNVENPTDDPVSVRVYLEDFTYVAPFSGDKEFSARGTTKTTISDMITFSPEQFTLEPHATRAVNFTIAAKRNIDKTLCGVLFFETSIGTTMQQGKAIDVLGRLGSLIFVDPASGSKNIKFTDITVSANKISGLLLNADSMFIDAACTYYVMDDQGMVYERGKANELYLLSQDQGAVECLMSKNLSAGQYTAVLTFDLHDGNILTKEVDFSVLPSGEAKTLEIRD